MIAKPNRTAKAATLHTVRGAATFCRPADIETAVSLRQPDGRRLWLLFQLRRLGGSYPEARGLRPGDDITATGHLYQAPDGSRVLDVKSFSVRYRLTE